MEGVIAVFIPIISIIVVGLVLVTYFYFRSKEKQMMIEKGMSYEQMMEFMKSRKNPYTMLKIGIVLIFFGIGIGIAMAFDKTDNEFMIPLSIFVFTGLGFVVSFYATKKLEEKESVKN